MFGRFGIGKTRTSDVQDIAQDGFVLARLFPELDLIRRSMAQQEATLNTSIFQPVSLALVGEPDCFYEGQGNIPYRGQDQAKELLLLEIASLGEVSPRLKALFTGPAGTGKTTLAQIVVRLIRERRVEQGLPEGDYFELLPAQVTEKALLDQFMRQVVVDPYSVVFIDEVHDLTNLESLFRVLQDTGELWYPMGDGTRLVVPDTISWMAATTDPGKLDKTTGGAMRRRMEPEIRLEDPDHDTLASIITDAGASDGRHVHPDAAYEMAGRALFPWQAKRIYTTALKVAVKENSHDIEPNHATQAFRVMALDENGLLREDRAVISALFKTNGGKGVTLVSDPSTTLYKLSQDNLCAMAGVDVDTYKKRIQPKLMRLGLLTTRGGQCLTDVALEKYGHLRVA